MIRRGSAPVADRDGRGFGTRSIRFYLAEEEGFEPRAARGRRGCLAGSSAGCRGTTGEVGALLAHGRGDEKEGEEGRLEGRADAFFARLQAIRPGYRALRQFVRVASRFCSVGRPFGISYSACASRSVYHSSVPTTCAGASSMHHRGASLKQMSHWLGARILKRNGAVRTARRHRRSPVLATVSCCLPFAVTGCHVRASALTTSGARLSPLQKRPTSRLRD